MKFTFDYLKEQFAAAKSNGYTVLTCEDYIKWKKEGSKGKALVNRVDVDFSIKKAGRIAKIFDELNIQGTFFIRLHEPQYNPFSFENYRTLKQIKKSGHEIGYHSEIIDQSVIWNEDTAECLKRDLDILGRMLDIEVKAVASHGGMTGLNNLDFWKEHKPSEFGLLYEAYDSEPGFNLFQESFYISDSEWIRWKCYNKGKKVENDQRSLAEHLSEGHKVVYSLIHPDTYYDLHFYDNEK